MGNFRGNSAGFGGRDSRPRSGFFGRSFGDSGRGRSFGRRDREKREMHDVICDKCKKKCQVPFKPSTDKPVLCSECFEKKGGSRERAGISKEQLDQINEKLDKILQKLEIAPKKVKKAKAEEKTEEKEDSE